MVTRALTDAQEKALACDYLNGDGQTVLARRYGVGQVTVRAALRRQGVEQRTPVEANAPKADPAEMLRLHLEEGLGAKAIGERLDVSASVVEKHLHRRGVGKLPNAKYAFDRAFFDDVTPVSAYWAGFIAADGSIVKNTVSIGLAEYDAETLGRLKLAARLMQPVHIRTQHGRHYVQLRVTSPEWVAALAANFDLRRGPAGKARTLQPPRLQKFAAHYLRGFFDGDGHATLGGCVIFTSASRVFLRWVELVMGPGSWDELRYPTADGQRIAWNLRYTRAASRKVARRMYADAPESLYLARKRDRLRCHI